MRTSRRLVRSVPSRVRRLWRRAAAPLAGCLAWITSLRVRRSLPLAKVDLVTIAFANTVVICEQHRLLHKYVGGQFCWVVLDNSPTRRSAKAVRATCAELGAAYWRIPSNPFTRVAPSLSHAFALDLSWRLLLRHRSSEVLGFLDHDVFPVEPFSPEGVLESQSVWGRSQRYDDVWYLWPGLMFIRSELARASGLSFMPIPGADTGSGNFPLIFATIDPSTLVLPAETKELVRGDGSVYQRDYIDRIGGWVHMINGSYWMPTAAKESVIQELLRDY